MREAIKFIKEKTGLVGVEIGVYKGENTKEILENLPIKKLYLVDPYEVYEDYPEQPVQLKQAESMATEKLSKYKDKIHFIKLKSSDAIHLIPDNLDFVYIDGNHKYEYVKQDIENYYPKLKIGGILAGHDYKAVELGVDKAVEEFVKKKALKINNKKADWWVVKC